MCYLHFAVCIFVTADGNNIPIIPILLPPRFAAWAGTSSALRVASQSQRRSRSTRRSPPSSEAPLLRRCLCFVCVTITSMFAFFVTATVTTFRSFLFCYPLVPQPAGQQARPRGWHRDCRGSQDQYDDHQHQVRLLFNIVDSGSHVLPPL